MSNTLAIATVTETMVRILTPLFASSPVGGATITATRPDDTTNLPPVGANIFLYQVSPNAYLRNADLPTRRSDGSLLRRPQAALDLHYLFTFYGQDSSLDQQRLLGIVVRQFHAQPVLRHEDIVSAQNNVAFLKNSDLADQTELIKFTPVNFSLEELSKLWSVFLKTDYVLSVAYVASVVLIETDDIPPATALPVLRRHVKAVPFSLAVIESVQPQAVALASPPVVSQLTLLGQNLDSTDVVTFLTFGESTPIPGTILGSSDPTQLVVELPAGLRPGINIVTLTHYTNASPPGSGRVIAQSNAAAFILRPNLGAIQAAGSQITAAVSPAVGSGQQVSLLLNQINPSPPGTSAAFELPGVADANQPGIFDFATVFTPVGSPQTISVPAGEYLARVRVDAAESSLEIGLSGGFSGPVVTIP
jgi:Pvc16 N-terminal domain